MEIEPTEINPMLSGGSTISGGKPIENTKSFFSHVFNFDTNSKNDMLNIAQYSILSIIPIILLNKSIQKYVPPVDDDKGTLEITAEIIIQIIVMFLGMMFIHRIITYIPTHSEIDYSTFNVTNIVLPFLIIVLSLQTKLGEKVNIIIERFNDILDGNISSRESMKNKEDNNVQPLPTPPPPPIATQQQSQPQQHPMPEMQSLYHQPPITEGFNNNNNNENDVMAANDVFSSFGSNF